MEVHSGWNLMSSNRKWEEATADVNTLPCGESRESE